ncbi:hypothetical protein CDD82_1319 [Ophiocordyceps australis]|uniref:RCC1-like domain-containing protein n=1 Tax=Ophiocordyceps australis TaxID=1399860 RepID=A0A2C5YKM9_9HYPO|nr:hypothetical protein CDD82_1319 [Ophiocordyceps australis]
MSDYLWSISQDGANNAAPVPQNRPRRRDAVNVRPNVTKDVIAIGSGRHGQLGLGPAATNRVCKKPRLILPATDQVVQLAVGSRHCAALTASGKILTWGINDSDALGRDSPHQTNFYPLEATAFSKLGLNACQVAVTDNATFILLDNGFVYGWGTFFGSNGVYGFLRAASECHQPPIRSQLYQSTPVQISGLSNVKQLAAGANHVVALTHGGKVYVWGSGELGELGRRIMSRHPSNNLVPRLVRLPRQGVKGIYAGQHHNFAIDTSGRVWAWGLNSYGQTGLPCNGSFGVDNTVIEPRLVDALADYEIRHIAGGLHHSLACTDGGSVLNWGRCDDGQAGVDLTSVPASHFIFDQAGIERILVEPVLIPDKDAMFVAAGRDDSFFISEAEQRVRAWGSGEDYCTGFNTKNTIPRPKVVRKGDVDFTKFDYVGCGTTFTIIAGSPGVVIASSPSPSLEGYSTADSSASESQDTKQMVLDDDKTDASSRVKIESESLSPGIKSEPLSPGTKSEASPGIKLEP